MKTKPFDLEAAKAGAPLVTRDGRKARFIGHVPKARKLHRVVVILENEDAVTSYGEHGGYNEGGEHPSDLVIQVQTKTVYVNLYKASSDSPQDWTEYSTKEKAENGAAAYAYAVAVPVEIEV